MRRIEEQMRKAVRNRKNWRASNTAVEVNDKGDVFVYLHGNLIMKQYNGAEPYFSLAGWNTVTTRSRLRALGCEVTCKDFAPYRDGKMWWGDF